MRSLILVLLFCTVETVLADKFVVHIGYHSNTEAAAFAVANNVTGDRGININCPEDTANNYMAIGSITLFCIWILYKLYKIEQNQKKRE